MGKNTRNNITLGSDFGNEYARSTPQGSDTRDMRARKLAALIVVFVVVLVAMILLPDSIFYQSEIGSGMGATAQLSLATAIEALMRNCQNLLALCTGNDTSTWAYYFFTWFVVAAAGSAMATCGSVYQSCFRNPLAAPKTLGVMGGAALGTFVYVLCFKDTVGPKFYSDGWNYSLADYNEWYGALAPLDRIWIDYGQALLTVAGCLLIVGIVVGISAAVGKGRISNITLIICGQIFAVGITALIQYFRYAATSGGDTDLANTLMEIEGATFNQTYDLHATLITVVPIVVFLVAVLLMRNRLMLLSFSDDEARTMGLNVQRTRYAMIVVCTIMVGWSIAFSGHIAFLGFITAHLSRKIMGPDMKYLLPASIFTGATFIMIIHKLTRMGLYIAPLGSDGMWTGMLGAFVFLVMILWGRRKEAKSDWVG